MIKLIDLLKEVQTEQEITAKLSPEELEQYQQAIELLSSEKLDEGIEDKLKKLGLKAAVIAALLGTPTLSPAQKAPVKDIAKITQTTPETKLVPLSYEDVLKNDSIRKLTPTDGKIGSVTSQFVFPESVQTNIAVSIKGDTTFTVLATNFTNFRRFSKINLTDSEMREWNAFIKWAEEKGYSGNLSMNNDSFRKKALEEYAEEHPNFTYLDEEKVKEVQGGFKKYRAVYISKWALGNENRTFFNIDIKEERMNPKKNEDRINVNNNFYPFAKLAK